LGSSEGIKRKINLDFSHPRGNIRMVELDNGEIWELDGECNRCGLCCEKTKMPIVEFQNDNGGCKYFKYETVNGEKLGKCNIMWTRPAFCMLYPSDPHDPLPDECSYKWKRIK